MKNWIDPKKKLPTPLETVLGVGPDDEGLYVDTMFMRKDGAWYLSPCDDDECGRLVPPLLWMPMPEIPMRLQKEYAQKINPFITSYYNGRWTGSVGADDRLDALQNFNLDECLVALKLEGLQKTVRVALERRIRKLEKK